MNETLLNLVLTTAERIPNALQMLTTIEIDGMSVPQENHTNVAHGLELLEAGKLHGDIATLAYLLSAGKRRTLAPGAIQEGAIAFLRISYYDFERLNYFPCWPLVYAEAYRRALQRNDYAKQVAITRDRVAHFIATRGTDSIEYFYEKENKKRRTP